jgi:hypothetical protein
MTNVKKHISRSDTMNKMQYNALAATVESATFVWLRKTRTVIVAGMMLLSCSVASAGLITFDDLPTISDAKPVPSGYKGLEWDNVYYSDEYREGSGYDHGRVSLPYAAFNAYADPMSIEGDLFYFESGYFNSAWNNNLYIYVKGYRDGILEYETTFQESPLTPTFREFGWTVDKLVFNSYGGTNAGVGGSGTHMVMDNLEITTNVPEPTAVLLALFGLTAMVPFVRRKMQAGS